MPLNPYTVDKEETIGIPSIKIMVYGPSSPLMCMSPVLQTLQFNWGCTPLIMFNDSNKVGDGFFLNSIGEYTSTEIGESIFEISFMVPVPTTSPRIPSAFLR